MYSTVKVSTKNPIFPIYRLGKLLISPSRRQSSISNASDCGRCRSEPLLGGYERCTMNGSILIGARRPTKQIEGNRPEALFDKLFDELFK